MVAQKCKLMNASELSIISGVSRGVIADILKSEKRKVSTTTAKKLCKALDVQTKDICIFE